MKHDTDKILRNKMSEASPDALLNDFDEEAIWQQIQQKNVPTKNAKKLYQYWPYAAVLAIGLFLGFYLNRNTGSETIYAKKIIEKQTVIDTVFISKSSPQTPTAIAIALIKKMGKPKREIQTTIEPNVEVQKSLVHESVVEPPSEEVIIPVAPKQEIAVVYFEDLKSTKENKNYATAKKKRRKLIELNIPNESESASQELPIRNLLFASNK